jgi:hypothetical protein
VHIFFFLEGAKNVQKAAASGRLLNFIFFFIDTKKSCKAAASAGSRPYFLLSFFFEDKKEEGSPAAASAGARLAYCQKKKIYYVSCKGSFKAPLRLY